MKLPLLIFIASVFSLFATDFLLTVMPRIELQRQGQNHPEIQAFLASIDNVIDATEGPIVEKHISIDLLNRVTVNPGFRLIHDPAMGREVIATGPEIALKHLNLGNKMGRIEPDFDRAIRLKDLVEIRLNLQAHGSREMRLSLNRVPEDRTVLQPDFVTEGPLNFRMLRIASIPDHPIQIASKDLMVYTANDLTNLYGTVDRLEIMYDKPGGEQNLATAPNLKFNKLLRTNSGTDN